MRFLLFALVSGLLVFLAGLLMGVAAGIPIGVVLGVLIGFLIIFSTVSPIKKIIEILTKIRVRILVKIPLFIAVVIMLGSSIALFRTASHRELCILLIVISLMFPIALFAGESKVLVKHTQNMWRASSKLPDDFAASLKKKGVSKEKIIELYELKEIARREAGWADYIHCGQTAAFAWILSCLLIWWWVDQWSETEHKWFEPSMWGAVWLLGFEMICEIHKQRHIDKLLADYEKLKTEIGKEEDNPSNGSQREQ